MTPRASPHSLLYMEPSPSMVVAPLQRPKIVCCSDHSPLMQTMQQTHSTVTNSSMAHSHQLQFLSSQIWYRARNITGTELSTRHEKESSLQGTP